MKTKIYILCFLFFVLQACEKEDSGPMFSLPPATQTGENTFGCYIDGRLLIPRSGTGTWMGPDVALYYSGYGLFPNYVYNEINVQDFKSSNAGLMDIHIIDLHENAEGDYTINKSNCLDGLDANSNINIRCRIWDASSQEYKWYCSIEDGGMLTITRYDFEAGIVSGTFSCTAVNRDDPLDTIEVTKGRFDINWKTLTPYTDFP